MHEEPRRPSCPDARTGYRARREAFAPAQPGTYRPAPVPMSGTQQAASHVHHAGSRASDVAPKQFYVTTRGSCLHLQSRASYRLRQFWKVPRDLRLQPFSICPAWADEDQIQASSRQGLRKTAMPKPSARAVNKRQPTLPARPVDSEAIHGGTWMTGVQGWRQGAATPRMIGRVRLEAMRDWSLCTVSKFGGVGDPSFPQVEASTKWSL